MVGLSEYNGSHLGVVFQSQNMTHGGQVQLTGMRKTSVEEPRNKTRMGNLGD